MTARRAKPLAAGLLVGVVALAWGLLCCRTAPDGRRDAASDLPASRPVAGPDTSTPSSGPTSRPRPTPATQPTTRPTSQPASQPAGPPLPPLPKYLQVLERVRACDAVAVDVRLTPPRKLELATRNVRRLRLVRRELPLARDRSVVLRIDGQVFEWTTGAAVVVLERPPGADWRVVARERRKHE